MLRPESAAGLRAHVRAAEGKDCRPTAAILDSQSVKSDGHGGAVGFDAAKGIKGRQRHLLVDTLGLVLGIRVTPASTPERTGAQALLAGVLSWFTWLRRLWVDGGYSGQPFADWVKTLRPQLAVEVVKRSDDAKGFRVRPRRWVVERTFGWLMRQRRLVRDYETTAASAQHQTVHQILYAPGGDSSLILRHNQPPRLATAQQLLPADLPPSGGEESLARGASGISGPRRPDD